MEKLTQKNITYIDRYNPPPGKTMEDVEQMAFGADYYFSSANAITQDGYILNVDSSGNRVAAIIYGPEKVYLVVGQNKVCKDAEAALKRNQDIAAPLNCKRLQRKTPCNHTGICVNCLSPERICRAYTLLQMAPTNHEITVVMIGEDLGY